MRQRTKSTSQQPSKAANPNAIPAAVDMMSAKVDAISAKVKESLELAGRI